jgi:hypothetical protein
MDTLPHWNREDKQFLTLGRERDPATAPISWIKGCLDQPTTFQWLERGGQRCSIHGKERSHGRHGWWLGPIQRHHQRELPVR